MKQRIAEFRTFDFFRAVFCASLLVEGHTYLAIAVYVWQFLLFIFRVPRGDKFS